MFADDLVDHIADELDREGRALVTDDDGLRLLVTTTAYLKLPGDELVLAYEGRGTIFFQLDRPLNQYRLLSSGFPAKAAHSVSAMVNRLVSVLADRRRVEATNVALEGSNRD